MAQAAMMLVMSGVEAGHCCPISMTYAAVPVLRRVPEIADEWIPRLTSTAYDPRFIPAAEDGLCGMAMTERQGGSDAGEHHLRAPDRPPGTGAEYEIAGHKWFCSAPMCACSSSLLRRRAASPALPCRAGRPTANATPPHRAAQGQARQPVECVERGRFDGAWARMVGDEGAASPPSSRWSTTRGSTASSAPRAWCAARLPPPITWPTARPRQRLI